MELWKVVLVLTVTIIVIVLVVSIGGVLIQLMLTIVFSPITWIFLLILYFISRKMHRNK